MKYWLGNIRSCEELDLYIMFRNWEGLVWSMLVVQDKLVQLR